MSIATSPTQSQPVQRESQPAVWLESCQFDLLLILGTTALALAAGFAVVYKPIWFGPLLVADLWLLGYHHVGATFTRLAFDEGGLKGHAFLIFVLPWFVLATTIALGYFLGNWAIATLYLYWQWFHYTRQSYGIAKVYLRKSHVPKAESRVVVCTLYFVALYGILHRSLWLGNSFLDLPVKSLPDMLQQYLGLSTFALNYYPWLTAGIGLIALTLAVTWLGYVVRAVICGERRDGLNLYVFSHIVIFYVGYCMIREIDYGWLAINVWHNFQYILFVWWFNSKQFKDGSSVSRPIASWLSQRSPVNVICYFLTVLGGSTLVYFLLRQAMLPWALTVPALFLITFQTVNFHHYIVDSLIWKRRKRSVVNG